MVSETTMLDVLLASVASSGNDVNPLLALNGINCSWACMLKLITVIKAIISLRYILFFLIIAAYNLLSPPSIEVPPNVGTALGVYIVDVVRLRSPDNVGVLPEYDTLLIQVLSNMFVKHQ